MTDALFDAQLTKLKARHLQLSASLETARAAVADAAQQAQVLDAELKSLAFAIETMEEVARGPAPTPAAPRAKRGSVEESVLTVLATGKWTIESIAARTEAKATSIKSAIGRLKKAGRVIEHDGGLYEQRFLPLPPIVEERS